MEIIAYCTIPAAAAVAKAVGVKPLTSPPGSSNEFPAERLETADFVYFRLHGTPKAPDLWFGESKRGELVPAFGRDNLDGLELKRSPVVVIANCFGDQSGLIQAFYNAGAGTVIAGTGPNYAAGKRVIGTDKLAARILGALKKGFSAETAVSMAKASLILTAWRAADRDAVQFQIIPDKREKEK